MLGPMQTTLEVDHHLVARVQLHTTGATAHDVYKLLGSYYDVAEAGANDPAALASLQAIERRMRAFCVTGRVPPET